MDKFGLIGSGISESLSGKLFNSAYGGRWSYDLIDNEDFEKAFSTFLSDYRGVNVTAPFKEKAFDKVLELAKRGEGTISGPCFKIGATNTLVHSSEGIEAHNSDFSGIILSVAEAYFPSIVKQCYFQFGQRGYIKVHQFIKESLPELFSDKPQALIVGCGGAGRAAAVAAAEMGFEVALMNRTIEKAQSLAAELPEYGFIPIPISDFVGSVKECDLIIYTLPIAIDALNQLSVEDFNENIYTRPKKVVLEANYKTPAFSGAVLDCLIAGEGQYVSGKQWLTWQGLTSYGIMTGAEPDFSALLSALTPTL